MPGNFSSLIISNNISKASRSITVIYLNPGFSNNLITKQLLPTQFSFINAASEGNNFIGSSFSAMQKSPKSNPGATVQPTKEN
jgi:hypothetical protein